MNDPKNPTIAKLTDEQLAALDLFVQLEKLPNRAAAMKLILDDLVKWAAKTRLQQQEAAATEPEIEY